MDLFWFIECDPRPQERGALVLMVGVHILWHQHHRISNAHSSAYMPVQNVILVRCLHEST